MKSKSLLIALAFSAIILFGFQALSPSKALTLVATVEIAPETINLDTLQMRPWITAYISIEGYSASDINMTTILLAGQFSPAWGSVEGNTLMVKFGASLVASYLWGRLNHMGNGATIELKITGNLLNGTPFEGTATVRIMDPPVT